MCLLCVDGRFSQIQSHFEITQLTALLGWYNSSATAVKEVRHFPGSVITPFRVHIH